MAAPPPSWILVTATVTKLLTWSIPNFACTIRTPDFSKLLISARRAEYFPKWRIQDGGGHHVWLRPPSLIIEITTAIEPLIWLTEIVQASLDNQVFHVWPCRPEGPTTFQNSGSNMAAPPPSWNLVTATVTKLLTWPIPNFACTIRTPDLS